MTQGLMLAGCGSSSVLYPVYQYTLFFSMDIVQGGDQVGWEKDISNAIFQSNLGGFYYQSTEISNISTRKK